MLEAKIPDSYATVQNYGDFDFENVTKLPWTISDWVTWLQAFTQSARARKLTA